ncbi:unnamed protein product, partial [Mesorhabditis belari]|uniref:AAA+ ATPase domain-containing protein n=1 Tax=Mesorhabditis belari TaxID=2138241 RepID=A0AAF3E9D7_9BILA
MSSKFQPKEGMFALEHSFMVGGFSPTSRWGIGVRRESICQPRAATMTAHQYQRVFSNFGSHFATALRRNEFLIGKKAPKKEISLFVNEYARILLRVSKEQPSIYIQRRGFRARKVTSGLQSRSAENEPPKIWPFSYLSEMVGFRKNDDKKPSLDKEKLASYESELKKVQPDQQKVFMDAYVKGLLTSRKGSSNEQAPKRTSNLARVYILVLSFALLYTLLGGENKGSSPLSFIFNAPQEVKPEDVQVTFEDVKGMDEAKVEVEEIVSYLRDPERYSRLGGRLPKGVLLVGSPGTGKTLLARAIAGEAQVPFFHTSGSEFDEVLVGQGARRVRDLFERAKGRAPCIIFIDEIDSVGSKRVSNSIHPYANQTINQLLSEMDGFNRNEGIIVIAATNRVEDLDKALLRPGRFDVRVTVSKPDLQGRKDIFSHYLRKIVHASSIEVQTLAKGTTGFTGADIENMVNQAALKAATENCTEVAMHHLDEARDRVLMGPARVAGRIPDEEANKSTAYHEAGHTLVGMMTKDSTPLHKVTIIPRGSSMGHTALLPDKDSYQMTKAQLYAQLDMMMGGRVAEELVFGSDKVTTGAADDLKKASMLALQMVKQFGFSDKVGLRDFSVSDSDSSIVKVNDLSPHTNETIDQEINRILKESYERAKEILTKHKKEHQALAEALLEYETLSAEEVKDVVAGKKLKRPTPAVVKRSNNEGRKKHSFVQIHIMDGGLKNEDSPTRSCPRCPKPRI